MFKRFFTLTLFYAIAFAITAQDFKNQINVINPETIAYDWDFNVIPDGTTLTAWNCPGVNGSGIATYFNIHDNSLLYHICKT